MQTNHEQFFIKRPVYLGTDMVNGQLMRVYQSDPDDGPIRRIFWSAEFPLPSVDQRVYITLNGIGWAVVHGYFVSPDRESGKCNWYVGVMTKATNLPANIRRQSQWEKKENPKRWEARPDWYKNGIGCEFGTEIALQNPNVIRKRKASGG